MNLQTIKLLLLRLAIFCLPFLTGAMYSHVWDDNLIYSFDVLLVLLYVIWAVESRSPSRGGIVFNAYCSTALLKIAWSAITILPAISQVRGAAAVIMLAKAFLMYFYLLNNVRTRETFDIVVHWLMVVLLFQGLVGVLQYTTGGSLGLGFLGERSMAFQKSLSRVRGTFRHPLQYSAFIIMLIPLAFSLFIFTAKSIKKTFYGVAALLALLALLLSWSRSAWASLLLAFGFFVLFLAKKRVLSARISIALGTVFIAIGTIVVAFWDLIVLRFETGSDPVHRIRMIEVAIPMITENPILGVGLFNYEFHSMAHFRFWQPVHNDYLRLAAETGIPGVLLFLIISFLVLRQGWKMLKVNDRFMYAVAVGILTGHLALLIEVNFTPDYQHYRVKTLFWVLAAMIFAMPRVMGYAEMMKKLRAEKIARHERMLKERMPPPGPAQENPRETRRA
jgi:O-antigen ligase